MASNDELRKTIVDMATESWRLSRNLNKVLSKLDYNDREKYKSQFMWFFRKVEDALSISNLKIIIYDGDKYDAGMSVTPINIDDFDPEIELYITQMLEPIIMDVETSMVIKNGVVMLGEAKNE